jgi:hypothetical protein
VRCVSAQAGAANAATNNRRIDLRIAYPAA